MTAAQSPLWTSAEAQSATEGRLIGQPWTASGVSIDSRSVAPGDLFIALAGPTHDGHDYVARALEAGAAAALVHRIPEGLPADARLLVVDDTLDGLGALGAAARARTKARIIAVTGSVGKTSTKEMLKLALEAAGPTHASVGSFNNHWGVPLSLARMPRETAYGVFELGMNHPGEITPLSRLVRPHVTIITTVAAVHMEFFASTAEIAEAKAEIFAGQDNSGIAILPRDNQHYALLRERAAQAGISRILTFGSHIESGARLLDCAVEADHTLVFALIGEQAISYRIGVSGAQWAANSLAVLQACVAANAPLDATSQALAAMTPPKGRGLRQSLAWDQGRVQVIDESYNASPVSMRAAVATLAAAKPGKGGRRIAVLGDMLELGTDSATMHAGLADVLVERGVDLVFTAGSLMRHLFDALPQTLRGGHAADSAESAEQVTARLQAGDVVVIKGSAGSRMSRVVQAIEQASAAKPPSA